MTSAKFVLAACLSFFGCDTEIASFAGSAYGDELTGTVTRVVDGDTIHVSVGLTKHVIRLSEIDTPERDQPWGRQASRALADKLARARVTVQTNETDRYGRLVGKVLLGSRDINREMVREGHAWVYRKYLRDRSLLEDERTARQRKAGLWGSDNPIEPWRWRRGERANNSSVDRPARRTGSFVAMKLINLCKFSRHVIECDHADLNQLAGVY